jgi:hypothetical protein
MLLLLIRLARPFQGRVTGLACLSFELERAGRGELIVDAIQSIPRRQKQGQDGGECRRGEVKSK